MSMMRLNPNAGLLVQRGTFATPTDLSSVTVNFPQAYSDVPELWRAQVQSMLDADA